MWVSVRVAWRTPTIAGRDGELAAIERIVTDLELGPGGPWLARAETRQSSAPVTAQGVEVRYLGSSLIPGKESCSSRFRE
jgi:hypothetical protein